MSGRPCTQYHEIIEQIKITLDDGTQESIGDLPILCPICISDLVGSYGIQPLKSGGRRKFQCKNPACPARAYFHKGKQFTLHTSALFKEALTKQLNQLLIPLLRGDSTQSALSQRFHRSAALMTHLRKKVQIALEMRQNLNKLVLKPTLEEGISLDEMFLKIEGKAVYIIMGTCYGQRKVLGIKVATRRDETMMRTVFNEAEQNNGKQFSLMSIDAWGGSMKMAKNLNRPIIVVIHKHKAPYIKAVIWKIEYESTKRILHKIGIKTDFFKFRRKREYYYLKEEEDLAKPTPKPRGRPKGVKNGQGTKTKYIKKSKEDLQKRGPKGIFTVFDKGKKGYARIDPKKKQVKITKGGSATVSAALNQVINFFGKMTIQNNLSENKNSVVEHRVWLSGPKDEESAEKRLRTFLFFLNNPSELDTLQIEHRLRGDLMEREIKTSLYGKILVGKWKYQQKKAKKEILN